MPKQIRHRRPTTYFRIRRRFLALANTALDPLDKELAARGHKFARYADDFIVMVKSANAAKRVMASLIRFCEGRLQLVVNRAKSRAVPLKSCELLRAMEAAAHALPQPVGTGSRSRNGSHGDSEPQRLLADEPE